MHWVLKDEQEIVRPRRLKELAQGQRKIVLQPEEGDWEGEGQGSGAVSLGKRKRGAVGTV